MFVVLDINVCCAGYKCLLCWILMLLCWILIFVVLDINVVVLDINVCCAGY